jgi:sugar O-acyltransferase (sialic acid O-acetyltransferase NeuD family)
MKYIAIYGAGGFGREIASLLKLINNDEPTWNLIGFFDDNQSLWGKEIGYGKVLGGIEVLNHWDNPLSVVIAIGVPKILRTLVDKITNPIVDFPNIVAPSVTFLDKESVNMGKGNIICSSCLLSCNVSLGDFNVLNGFIPIGHDTVIGNFNVIMPSTNISGGVNIGDGNFLGVKSTVLQYVSIGNNVRIGAGSVVMRNTKDGNLYMGNPATKIKL